MLEKLKTVRDAVHLYDPAIVTSFGHMSLRGLIAADVIPARDIEHAFVFTTVRNPYSRAVSLYRYLRQKRNWMPAPDIARRFEAASHAGGVDLDAIRADFVAFLRVVSDGVPPVGLYNVLGLSQSNPQHHWTDDVKLDHVGRFETLEDDFAEISLRVLGRRAELPRINVSKVANDLQMSDFLTEEAAGLIRHIYADDFRIFGYSTDVP